MLQSRAHPEATCATVIAHVPMRIVLQCRLAVPAHATCQTRVPRCACFLRCPCYSDRTHPDAYVATIIARVPRRTLLQCRHVTRDGGSRPLRIPITVALAIVIARFPRRPCYRDRTHPEASCATVSPSGPCSCNPEFTSHASRGACATVIARFPRRPCYNDRTRP